MILSCWWTAPPLPGESQVTVHVWKPKDRAWQCDASPSREEEPKKAGPLQGRWGVKWGTGLAFRPCPLLVPGEQPRVMEHSTVWLPDCPHLPKAFRAPLPWQGEHGPKFQQQVPPVNPTHGPRQGWEMRGHTLSDIPTIASQRRCPNPVILIPIGGRR